MDWISEFADYCHREGLNIHDGQSVKLFLVVYRHDTPKVAKRSNKRQFQRSKILSRRRLESSSTVFFQLSSITQSLRRAAVPPVLSADSRAFAVPSVVYNLNNCTVHNIASFT